jgi:transposase-like protein
LEAGRTGPSPHWTQNPFRYFNGSPEVILLAAIMYIRYPSPLRQVEDLLHERGVDVSHLAALAKWRQLAAGGKARQALSSPVTLL